MDILEIKGNVQYKITLDPSVWIFDDRKIDLNTFFDQQLEANEEKDDNAYIERISKNWEKLKLEGASISPDDRPKRKLDKQRILSGTFGMRLGPFINNAEPFKEAKEIILETMDGEIHLSLEQGRELILCFAKNGKPLKEDGPVHGFFPDGSNRGNPIKNIRGIVVL